MASLVAQDSALVKCRKHHEMECFFVNTIRRSPYTTIGYSLVIGDGPQLPATAARHSCPSRRTVAVHLSPQNPGIIGVLDPGGLGE